MRKENPFFATCLPGHCTPRSALRNSCREIRKRRPPRPPTPGDGHDLMRLVQNNAVYARCWQFQLDTGIDAPCRPLTEKKRPPQQTCVVFMADNGGLSTSRAPHTSNLPLRAGKGWPYEAASRPWIRLRLERNPAARHSGHQHRLLSDLAGTRGPASQAGTASRRRQPRAAAQGRGGLDRGKPLFYGTIRTMAAARAARRHRHVIRAGRLRSSSSGTKTARSNSTTSLWTSARRTMSRPQQPEKVKAASREAHRLALR